MENDVLSVAEVWLADDLAGLSNTPLPRLQADLYRCGRETGWHPGQMEGGNEPYVIHQTVQWREPRGGAQAQMRVSILAPIIGFVGAPSSLHAWGLPYLDLPPLTGWWQRAGWLLPDPAWLNAPFSTSELIGLPEATARELRRWPTLSRGDALFFEW